MKNAATAAFFIGIRLKSLRRGHHVVDRGSQLRVGERLVAAFRRHRFEAVLRMVEEHVGALRDARRPLRLVAELRRSGKARAVADRARGVVDLLAFAGARGCRRRVAAAQARQRVSLARQQVSQAAAAGTVDAGTSITTLPAPAFIMYSTARPISASDSSAIPPRAGIPAWPRSAESSTNL